AAVQNALRQGPRVDDGPGGRDAHLGLPGVEHGQRDAPHPRLVGGPVQGPDTSPGTVVPGQHTGDGLFAHVRSSSGTGTGMATAFILPTSLAKGGLGCAWRPSPKRGHQSRNTDSWEALMSVQRATVLVGIDGSPDSDRALGWAADEAARFGMSLRIVHVAETATLDVAGRGAGEVSEALAEAGDRILQDGRGLA